MTGAEIIKALEWCTDTIPPCHACKYDEDTYTSDECMGKLMKDALDLINRQKAEIDILIRKKETLRDEVADKDAEIERLHKQEKTVAKMYYLKGVRDLAKRIRDKFYLPPTVEKKFDNILKELGGDTENGEKKD